MATPPEQPRQRNNLGPIIRELVLEASRADDLIAAVDLKQRPDEVGLALGELLDEARRAERVWRLEPPALRTPPTRESLVRIAAIAVRLIRDAFD